jgi:hypothetical protein
VIGAEDEAHRVKQEDGRFGLVRHASESNRLRRLGNSEQKDGK